MPNGIILNTGVEGYMTGRQTAAIVKDPANANRYYIFTLIVVDVEYQAYRDTASLFYSIVDMSKNNGLGTVLPEAKKIFVEKDFLVGAMTVAQGEDCNAWLILRAKTQKTLKSFEINAGGIVRTPVISEAGKALYPKVEFFPFHYGTVKVSPDRHKLALYVNSGEWLLRTGDTYMELYDFNAKTGKVTDPVLLYEMMKTMTSGVCFSPNSSKLYFNFTVEYNIGGPHPVFQFDLSLNTTAAIIASMALVTPPDAVVRGDMKIGPDGRIYCYKGYGGMPGIPPAGAMLFYFNQPDLPGMASQFTFANALYPGFDSRVGFPNENALVTYNRKEEGSRKKLIVCSKDTFYLKPEIVIPGNNLIWMDSIKRDSFAVWESGSYYVHYAVGCIDRADTFDLDFYFFPLLETDSFSCVEGGTGNAWFKTFDPTSVDYTWMNEAGTVIGAETGNKGARISGLLPGKYSVKMDVEMGCDTLLYFTILPREKPQLILSPQDTTILYGDTVKFEVTGALFYVWSPVYGLDDPTSANPIANPREKVSYTVIGTDVYGCRDTGYATINIDFTMPDFIPTAFSPNGDGINDIFKVEGLRFQKIAVFKVFDRLGKEVFSADQNVNGWDGSYKGKPCDMGVYHYIIRLTYPGDEVKTYKGTVTLLR